MRRLHAQNASLTITVFSALFLLSARAGYYADQVEKSQWIQKIKQLEIGIMALGIICLWFDLLLGLMILWFLMGTQSALFSPVKYAITDILLQVFRKVGCRLF